MEAGDPRPAGTLAGLVALTSCGAGRVAVTRLTGLSLRASREEVILLTSLTVSPSPASPALETLHPVTSLAVQTGAELTAGGPAIALTRCKYYHQVRLGQAG